MSTLLDPALDFDSEFMHRKLCREVWCGILLGSAWQMGGGGDRDGRGVQKHLAHTLTLRRGKAAVTHPRATAEKHQALCWCWDTR